MTSLRKRIALVFCGVAALATGAAVALQVGARGWATGLLGAQVVGAGVLMYVVCRGACGRLDALRKAVESGGEVTGAGECAELGRAIGRVIGAHRGALAASQEHLNLVLEAEGRRQRAAQALIDGLPHGVAFLTPAGRVEQVNSRGAWFGLERGKAVEESPHGWLKDMVGRAVATRQSAKVAGGCAANGGGGGNGGCAKGAGGAGHGREGLVQMFEEGRELFFAPEADPLIDEGGALTGVVVTLVDVTGTRQAEEARANLLAALAHEIRTPMTSLQMSLYLLLDDAAMRLTPRQLELLRAARDEADRLHRFVESSLAHQKG